MRLQYTGLLVNSPSDLQSACALFGLPQFSHPKFWFWKRVCVLDAQAAIVLHETFHLDEILYSASRKHVTAVRKSTSKPIFYLSSLEFVHV